MAKKVLLAGESWSSTTIHTKGFDSFVTSAYAEGAKWLIAALEEGGYEVEFMQNHYAPEHFPSTIEQIKKYSAVILSDIGSNTLLLHPETFVRSAQTPNRCDVIKQYVLEGGALCMVGGYLTFTGIDAKGRWGQTAVKDVLPVLLQDIDDRMENPQGIAPEIVDKQHDIMRGLPGEWPKMLGYNKAALREGAQLIATIGGDPFVAAGTYGLGRSAIFSSDCSPHWAPPEFCDWPYYNKFWQNLLDWLTAK